MRFVGLILLLPVVFAVPAMAYTTTSSQATANAFSASRFLGSCGMSFDGRHVLTHYISGFADVAEKQKYELNTIQPVASVSKTFIGLALAQLAIEKKLNLDAPIDNYLPWKVRNPNFPRIPITLRELATHTSGLIDTSVYNKIYENGHKPRMSMREFVKQYTDSHGKWFSAANFTRMKPGTHYEYSNLGADLAAVVIEYRTGESFDRYITAHFFKPLGLKDTSYTYRASARNSILYSDDGRPLSPYTEVTYADGGIRTTCMDLARYLQAVLRARGGKPSPLNSAVVTMALAPQFRRGHLPSGLDHPNQGLFWSYNAMTGIGHDGGDPGVTSLAYVATDNDRGFVFIANESMEDNPGLLKSAQAIWHAWLPYK